MRSIRRLEFHMHLFVQFPAFSNTAAIDKYIEKRLKTLQKRLDARYKNPTITLRGAVVGRKPDGQAKAFEAEILVKTPRSKAPFVVKKRNSDFRSALNDAADAMESILKRDNEKSERSRKTAGKSPRPARKAKDGAAPKR